MRDLIVRSIRRGLGRYGYELTRTSTKAPPEAGGGLPPDFDPATIDTVRAVDGYTMTGPERLYALCHAVRYIARCGIGGAIVECGVWRGGSMMAAARTLMELGEDRRDLYLFDTYEGMPAPTEHDVDLEGVSVLDRWNAQRRNRLTPREARASLTEVQQAVRTIGYDADRVHFVKGMVEDTIPAQAPERIALLRLDTDYYESTRHELFQLYPRLSSGGVLIIDDYGHFRGSEKAVQEFIDQTGARILLHRVDYSARVAVKP